MADPQQQPTEDTQRQPPNGAEDGGPIDWEARAREAERKYGSIVNENKRVKASRDALSEKIKGYAALEEAGHTPEQLAELAARETEASRETAKDRGVDLDKMIANATRVAEKKAQDAEARATKASALVERVLIDDVLNRLLDKYVEPKYKKAVFSMLRPKMEKMDDPEDEYGVRPVVKVGDDYLSADEFLKNWAETDDEAVPFLKQSLAGGGGASNSGGTARLRFKGRKEMTPKEKSEFIQAHGKIEYDKLPWERA